MKFIHLRNIDPNGQVSCKGGATVAYDIDANGQIKFAVARCNTTDHFVKAQGRAKAGGRMNSQRHAHIINGMDEQAFFAKIQRNWAGGPMNVLSGLAAKDSPSISVPGMGGIRKPG